MKPRVEVRLWMQAIMDRGHTLKEAAALLEVERIHWHESRLALRASGYKNRGPQLQNTVAGFCKARIDKSWGS